MPSPANRRAADLLMPTRPALALSMPHETPFEGPLSPLASNLSSRTPSPCTAGPGASSSAPTAGPSSPMLAHDLSPRTPSPPPARSARRPSPSPRPADPLRHDLTPRTRPRLPPRRAAIALLLALAAAPSAACKRADAAPLHGPAGPPPDARRSAHEEHLEFGVRPPPPDPGPVQVVAPPKDAPLPCAADPRIRACVAHRGDEAPHLLGMASAGGRIAVAWVAAGNTWLPAPPADPPPARVGVALFDAALTRLSETTVTTRGPARDVDVIAIPGGWALAAQTPEGIEIHWLDPVGAPTGRTAALPGYLPGLTASPTGELLVVHVAAHGGRAPVVATLLDRRGAARWSAEVFDGSVEANFGGQVAADRGAFLVARRSDRGVAVRRIDADGRAAPFTPVGQSTEYPSLAWCGDAGRLVWTDFASQGHVRAATIDGAGVIRSPEHVLGAIPAHFNHSQPLCDGPGALVLLAGYTGGTGVSKRLDLVRVDPAAGALPGAIQLLADDGRTAYDPRITRLDPDRVAVAWIAMRTGGASSIALAVVDAPVGARPLAHAPARVAE